MRSRSSSHARRSRGIVGVACTALALMFLAPVAARAVPVTIYSNGFESALNSGGNPGWDIGASPWSGSVLSGAAPGVVFPGGASPARVHAGSGSLWSAADFMGAEDFWSSLDNVDAYYDVRVRIVAPSGTSAGALADIDAVESRYGGQWLRLESDAATSAVVRAGFATTAAGDRFSPYGGGGRTSLASAPGDSVEFRVQGDAGLGSASPYNPRRQVGIIVGARGPGTGRGGINYWIDTSPPGAGSWTTVGSGTINESSSYYDAGLPTSNRYPPLMNGYVRQPLDLRPYGSVTYRAWYYVPYSLIEDASDAGFIEVIRRSDGRLLHSLEFSGLQYSRWYEWTEVLGPGKGPGEEVWMQFRWRSDQDLSSEGMYFDDLVVSGELPPPAAPAVTSSTHPTQTVWYKNATPAFSWNVTSPVVGYSWVIDGAASTTPDQIVDGDGSVTSWQAPTQPSGDRYFHIAAKDSANQWSPATHRRAKVDVQPPTTPSVNDGVASWSTATTRAVTWSSSDAHSGLGQFLYGTSPSGPFISAPATSTGAVMGPFSQGTSTVYVAAEDALGSRSTTGTHPVYVDTSAPSTPAVTDEGQYTPFTTRTAASWTATDTYSGVASYDYAIGTTPGGTQTRTWTNVGSATSVEATGFGTLTTGTAYYVSVRARDAVGLTSPVGTADGITPMDTAISAPTVTDDGTSTASGASMHGSWTPVSGAMAYRVSVGSSPLATDLAGWGSELPTTTLQTTVGALSIPDGTTAYFNVHGKNVFGDWGLSGTSNGILVDSSPPAAPTVSLDGTVSASLSSIHFSLDATDTHSGLSSVSYALGTSPGWTDIKGWTTVAPATDVTATGLTLSDGQQVYASARATNMLGATGGTGTSAALLIDSSPPEAFTLTAPTGGFWTASTEPTFTWASVTDTVSGVRRLELMIDGNVDRTLGPSATQAVPQTAITTEGAHTWTVRAFDGAENTRTPAARTLNFDKTRPATPTVTMAVASQFATDHLAASWSATDIPSGVGRYEYAIGSAPGLTDVRGWTNAGAATSLDATGLALGSPSTYYFSVRAYDLAGNDGPPGTAPGGTVVKAPSQAILTAPSSSVAGRPLKLIVDAGREGAQVRIYQRVGTATSLVASLVTGADGSTSRWVYPRSHTTYWATVVEDALYGPATSANKLVRVYFSVSASASPVTARAGSYIYFTGKVVPSPARRYVVLQRKIGRYWRNVRIMRVSSSGWYIRNRVARPRGYSYWRVRALPDSLHLPGYSPARRVRGL